MKITQKLRIVVSFIFLFVAVGCGSKDTAQDAKPTEKVEAPVAQENKVETPAPVETPKQEQVKPEPVAIVVDGVPNLDPNVGPTLGDVVREESKQFNKDGMARYKKKDYEKADIDWI